MCQRVPSSSLFALHHRQCSRDPEGVECHRQKESKNHKACILNVSLLSYHICATLYEWFETKSFTY